MRRITKQRLWYEGSRIVCIASVVGLMSALGRMEWGELPTEKGMTLAAVYLLTAAVFGRLAEAIHAVWEREKRSTDTAKRVA